MGTSSVFFPASGIDSANIEATRHCCPAVEIRMHDLMSHDDFNTMANEILQKNDFGYIAHLIEDENVDRDQFPSIKQALRQALRQRYEKEKNTAVNAR